MKSTQLEPIAVGVRARPALAVAVGALLALLTLPGTALAVVTVDGPASPQDPGSYKFSTSELGAGYSWTCDGVPSASEPEVIGSSTTCSFTTRGSHSAGVTVDSGGGTTDSGSRILTISIPPDVTIMGAPASAHIGAPITLTTGTAGGPELVSYVWRLNGSVIPGATANSVTLALSAEGRNTVSVATSEQFPGGGSGSDSVDINGTNARPTAALKLTSPGPFALGATGASVQLDATGSSDPEGDGPLTYAWDFGDGSVQTTIAPLQTAQHTYAKAGSYIASVTVTDKFGKDSAAKTVLVQVVNSGLTSAFTFAPAAPQAGQAVTFTSTSVGPDSPITSQLWDLDNDGQYDDASGPSAQWTFAAGGSYQVSLQVKNANGIASASFQTVTVSAPVGGAGTPTGITPITRLKPFPIVRLRGRIVSGGVRITLFTIRAPKGAKVRVRCRGRGCPYAARTTTARSSIRPVRFQRLERRLRAGAVIEVLVTKSGKIGKYTRFRIQRGKAPTRMDRCLPSGSFKPTLCSLL